MIKIKTFPKREPNVKAWMLRLLLGPASIADGVVETLTFGFYGIGTKLHVARRLADIRFLAAYDEAVAKKSG